MVRLWDAATGVERHALHKHTGAVMGVAFSQDGKTLASASCDHTVCLWDVASGDLLDRLDDDLLDVHTWDIAWSPDGPPARQAGSDAGLRMWTADKRQLVRTVSTPAGFVAFSPDGKTLWTGRHDQTAGPPTPLRALESGHGQGTRPAAAGRRPSWVYYRFSPDGKTLVAFRAAETVLRLYDAVTGKPCFPVTGHIGAIRRLSFSPDGRLLASAGFDGAIKLWDMSLGSK